MTILVSMETSLSLEQQEAKLPTLSKKPGTQESYTIVLKARERIVVEQNKIEEIGPGHFSIKHFIKEYFIDVFVFNCIQ